MSSQTKIKAKPGSRNIESEAPVSQLVNAEVNSGNHKVVLASNYTMWMPCRIAGMYYLYSYLLNTQTN